MALRLAYSTNAYTRWPLERALADIREAGFGAAEILADTPHAFPASTDAAGLRDDLSRLGLAVSNLNGNTSLGLDPGGRDPEGFWPSLIDPDPDARERRIDSVCEVVDLARALGAACVCTATGRRVRGVTPSVAERLLLDALERILAHAEREPRIRVGIEYEPGFFVGDRRSLLSVLGALEHPLLGANLDLGHAVCVGEDPAETIAELGGRIWNLHLEDIRGRVHDHLVPGEGDIDFARIARALETVRYDGWVTLELYPYKDDPGGAGRRALAHLASLGLVGG